ncbi:hypothetical protein COV22_00970 [Candidatus Woesearchaeota archaeon CG10_big_fil_rev_8_21_14_0_10_47_5]|nr:MAG: hypothetical protein COV22_00970 [Candidatus Woesearchaeota archaeon CG10_big_fil_rev_8_21_14_0_10_47_5]
MLIGYSSRWMFRGREMSIFEEVEFAHSLGFQVFALNLDRKQNRRLRHRELVQLREQASRHKMRLAVRFPHHLNTSVKSKKLVDEIKRGLRIATVLGADRLMVHPGCILQSLELDFKTSKSYRGRKRGWFNISEEQIAEQFNQLIFNLHYLVTHAGWYKIRVALENNAMPYQFGSNLKEYCRILESVKGLKASISTGHAHISRNSVYTFISRCRGRIINLDLHDNNGRRDSHLAVGDGNIKFRRILRGLKNKRGLTVLVDTYTNRGVERSVENLRKILSSIH